MRHILPAMAVVLSGTHRILSVLLEKEGITITGGIKSKDSIQKLAEVLLQDSGGKLLNDILVKPMDKYSKHSSKESVRRTIMEHDEIFRQQVHELHRLYSVQKKLMAKLAGAKQSFQTRTDETQEMIQGSRPNLKSSTCTSEGSQSARLGNAQNSAPQQVFDCSFLQDCKPASCLNLFSQETSRNQEGKLEKGKSAEGESWNAYMENDLDLKLSTGTSSHARKSPHWLFSGSRDRNPSGQHR